jgi:hypothetical protein
MPERVLTLREINRATLSRQMLLERAAMSAPAAIERLVGLQAQQASSPYVGLWTRLPNFQRKDLAGPIHAREVVKTTLLRGTLHLCTAGDYIRFRPLLQPMLTEGWWAIAKKRNMTFEKEHVLEAAREFIAEAPRTFEAISKMLTELLPDQDVGAMRYAVRTHLPLVQVPVANGWSYPGNPEFTLADSWLGSPVPTDPQEDDLQEFVFRYLAAFGPATAADMQTWSGLPNLKETFQQLKPKLQTYRDEKKRELFDLPDMPLPPPDVPAPVRFLPEYDNILLSHSIRTRVIANEHRSKVYLPGLRVRATILVDGFVRGGWKVEKTKGTASLLIEPFDSITSPKRAALAEEAEQLVRFMEPDAKAYEVRFAD